MKTCCQSETVKHHSPSDKQTTIHPGGKQKNRYERGNRHSCDICMRQVVFLSYHPIICSYFPLYFARFSQLVRVKGYGQAFFGSSFTKLLPVLITRETLSFSPFIFYFFLSFYFHDATVRRAYGRQGESGWRTSDEKSGTLGTAKSTENTITPFLLNAESLKQCCRCLCVNTKVLFEYFPCKF